MLFEKYNKDFDISYLENHWIHCHNELCKKFQENLSDQFLKDKDVAGNMVVNYLQSGHEVLLSGKWKDKLGTLLKHDTDYGGIRFVDYYGVKTSYNRVRYAQFLARAYNELNINICNQKIIEFGGGYGGMAETAYIFDEYKKYTIIDLPVFCYLQEKYCEANKIPVDIVPIQKASSVTDKYDIFIATWSLSESNQKTQNIVFDKDFYGAKYFIGATQDKSDLFPSANRVKEMLIKKGFKIVNNELLGFSDSRYLFGIKE